MSAAILDSIGKHGLKVSSVDYDPDGRVVRYCFHAPHDFSLDLRPDGWRAVRRWEDQPVTPGDLWDAAQRQRAEARSLDELMGVLADLGQRVPEDDGA